MSAVKRIRAASQSTILYRYNENSEACIQSFDQCQEIFQTDINTVRTRVNTERNQEDIVDNSYITR